MCEACDDPQFDWEETTRVAADENWTCDEEDCTEAASWCTRFAMVDEHVCDAHKGPDEPALQGLLASTGLMDASYFVAIRASEACEGEILGPACRARARWAHVVLSRSFACEEHRPAEVESNGGKEATPP